MIPSSDLKNCRPKPSNSAIVSYNAAAFTSADKL